MTSYFDKAKLASWLMLAVTVMIAGLIVVGVVFASGMFVLVKHLMMDDAPGFRIPPPIWLVPIVVLVPALWLVRFYIINALRPVTLRAASFGWSISALYHSALSWVLLFYAPATVRMGDSLKVPMVLFTGTSALLSLYFLVRYPRPPKLAA